MTAINWKRKFVAQVIIYFDIEDQVNPEAALDGLLSEMDEVDNRNVSYRVQNLYETTSTHGKD